MIRALYTAASGMSAQQMNLDTIANNLANSSTTGFRQLRLQFQDMVYQNLITPGAAQSETTVSAGLQIGLGTRSAATGSARRRGHYSQPAIHSILPLRVRDIFRSKPQRAPDSPAMAAFIALRRVSWFRRGMNRFSRRPVSRLRCPRARFRWGATERSRCRVEPWGRSAFSLFRRTCSSRPRE